MTADAPRDREQDGERDRNRDQDRLAEAAARAAEGVPGVAFLRPGVVDLLRTAPPGAVASAERPITLVPPMVRREHPVRRR
ncbi:hypothetical protein ABTZ98_26345, partial [Streptomyces bacillaris]